MNVMSSYDKSDAVAMSTDMLEDIRNGSQFYASINKREAHYKIRDCIKQGQMVWKGALLSTRNMGKYLQ